MNLETRLLRSIDSNKKSIIKLTRELIQTDSVNPPGDYAQISGLLRDAFREQGIWSTTISAPRNELAKIGIPAPRPNVVAKLHGKTREAGLLLFTHLDTVAVETPEKWRYNPFSGKVVENRIYGLGSCDAKCGLAAIVFGARALIDADVKLQKSLLLAGTVDDESRLDRFKWPGTRFLVEDGFRRLGLPLPRMVINGEASGLSNVAGSFKGRIFLEITVPGETAHAGIPQGRNAILDALTMIKEIANIRLLSSRLHGKDTVNLVVIRGGAKRWGDIPSECTFGLEIRVVPPGNTMVMVSKIRRAIEKAKRRHPEMKSPILKFLSNRDPIEVPKDHRLINAIVQGARRVGVQARYSGIVGTGELQPFLTRGIPGVTYGSGNINRVHRPNEFIAISEVLKQAKIYALTAKSVCGA